MQIRKSRWSKVYESSEEELVGFLSARGTDANRWTVSEFETLPARQIESTTDIYLAEGSATFRANNTAYSMQPGDAIALPAETRLIVAAGMSGCVCYEVLRSR